MKKITKSDLRDGDVVMYDNGKTRTVKGTNLLDCFETVSKLEYYDEDLRHEEARTLDIVEVFRSIWKREEPTITSDERVLLENIDKKYQYIARDDEGWLFLFEEKPKKDTAFWQKSVHSDICSFGCYAHLFKMVKWEDDEPWTIEDLLKFPVKKNVT